MLWRDPRGSEYPTPGLDAILTISIVKSNPPRKLSRAPSAVPWSIRKCSLVANSDWTETCVNHARFAPTMQPIGTPIALNVARQMRRRTPGTEGLPPRPVRRDELPGSATQGPSPVALGLSPRKRNITRLDQIYLHSSHPRSPRLPELPRGDALFCDLNRNPNRDRNRISDARNRLRLGLRLR